MTGTQTSFIRGQLLVAMPDMGDPRFARSAVYVFSHDAQGAMGFIINKPEPELQLGSILENLPTTVQKSGLSRMPIFIGGPVENDHGFILHTSEFLVENSIVLPGSALAMTQTLDILVSSAAGKGPRQMRLLLGYAGWAAGQLEAEIQANAWLVAPYDEALVFDEAADTIYDRSLRSIGVDMTTLVSRGGEA